jgi:hypothetical protein
LQRVPLKEPTWVQFSRYFSAIYKFQSFFTVTRRGSKWVRWNRTADHFFETHSPHVSRFLSQILRFRFQATFSVHVSFLPYMSHARPSHSFTIGFTWLDPPPPKYNVGVSACLYEFICVFLGRGYTGREWVRMRFQGLFLESQEERSNR